MESSIQIDPKAIRNILVVRNDRFGEFLLNLPALRALKETFTQARLIAVIDPSVEELAKTIPFIDETIEWGKAKHSFIEKIRLTNCLRKRNIDLAVVLNPSKEFHLLTWLSGISIRAGYNRKWGFLLTEKKADKKYLGDRHEVEYNLELVGLVGATTQDKRLTLKIENGIIAGLLKSLNIESDEILIAVHPWTSDPLKQWPKNNFLELANKLSRELNLKVIIVGGRENLAESKTLFNGISPRLINLTAKTTLSQLAALLKKCRLLISGDSGPVHLAACLGTSVIALFRNDLRAKSAKRWGPWGEGHLVIEKDSLSGITPEEVFVKVKEAIK